ncbi:hypothetical protein TD95_004114 [Thielaviopsis punctulata]|uniref:C2H2-type domain-containing protein n=1 Tax=Thielaviopsis punctulata TaxID=72032 RepID=A0A0F4ZME8_9PEZI|nr:hypothetical protein TD95_004114 [Thielaviopsis punctulata]
MSKRKADEVLDIEADGVSVSSSSFSSAAAAAPNEQNVNPPELQALPTRAKRVKAESVSEDHESNYDSDSSSSSISSVPPVTRSKPRPKNQICTWPGCTKRYNRPTRLESHMRSHRGERPFACSFPGCDKTYIEAKHLSQHVEAKHEGKRNHHCPYPDCGRAFFTSTRLSRHVTSHIKAQQFQCKGYPGCKQIFRRKDTLNRHVRQVHLHLPGYTCPEPGCTEAFASSGALRNHRHRAHGELKHFCDECKVVVDGQERSLGFTHISDLRNHFRSAHMSCSFCPYRCTYPSEMDRHLAMRHSAQTVSDRKTVPCPWPGCGKMFTKKSNMVAHAKSSHDGYRFVCGLVDLSTSEGLAGWDNAQGCREGFVTKANLESHIRHIHLGQQRAPTAAAKPKSLVHEVAGAEDAAKRTLTCDCGRGFIRYHDLQVHLELDHGRVGGSSAFASSPADQTVHAQTAALDAGKYDASANANANFSAFLSPALTPHAGTFSEGADVGFPSVSMATALVPVSAGDTTTTAAGLQTDQMTALQTDA